MEDIWVVLGVGKGMQGKEPSDIVEVFRKERDAIRCCGEYAGKYLESDFYIHKTYMNT